MYAFYIVWTIILIIVFIQDDSVWEKIKLFFSASFLASFVVFIIILLVTLIVSKEDYEYRDVRIESLTIADNQNLSGSFILGTGTISGSNYETYVVHVRYPQGIKRIHINTNNAFIRETDNEPPHIKNFEYRTSLNELNSNWLLKRKAHISNWRRNTDNITIVVPKNTIIYQFNIE